MIAPISGDLNGAVVRTRGLTKYYGSIAALRNLALELYPGEVFGLLGPNGAGKTTTVKLLLGLLRPTAGEIYLFGQPLAGNLPHLLRQVGAIVEAPAFYPYLSGRENLRLLAMMDGLPLSRVDLALEQVDLREAAGRKFGAYSLGMKQRLGIAATLLRDPRLIILDEPTSGLDPAGQHEVRALIPRLAGEGRTVFLSSHLLYEVQQVCDRVGILKAGELLAIGPVTSLLRPGGAIEVRVPNVAAAQEVLRRLPWVTSLTEMNGYLVVGAPPERSAEVNAALAGAGIFASEIRPRERTLEAFFLEVTGERNTP